MTDKQIIIDGVDVSGCKHFKIGTCLADYLLTDMAFSEAKCELCKDCYYKQLKCKEQECEKLEQTLAEIKEIAEEQVPYLNIGEAKTMIEIEYDYAGAICNLKQRMYKILQKISECKVYKV